MNVKFFIALGIAIAGMVVVARFFNNEFSIKPGDAGLASFANPPAVANAMPKTMQTPSQALFRAAQGFAGPPKQTPAPQTPAPEQPMPAAAPSPGPAAVAPAMLNVAQPPAPGPDTAPEPAVKKKRTSPPNFLPRDIQLSEAHWQGMDVAKLTPELRQKLRYPKGLLGIIIDEVTLNSAGAGFLAGDIITHVAGIRVTTLEEYQQASRSVRSQRKATLTVLRKGDPSPDGRFAMKRVMLVLPGDPDLGFAQVEAAPMIVPGDGRPHPYRGPCTNCHTVGVGFELTPDPDMITLPPPALSHATVVKGISPHRDRGPCEACHLIIR